MEVELFQTSKVDPATAKQVRAEAHNLAAPLWPCPCFFPCRPVVLQPVCWTFSLGTGAFVEIVSIERRSNLLLHSTDSASTALVVEMVCEPVAQNLGLNMTSRIDHIVHSIRVCPSISSCTSNISMVPLPNSPFLAIRGQ